MSVAVLAVDMLLKDECRVNVRMSISKCGPKRLRFHVTVSWAPKSWV